MSIFLRSCQKCAYELTSRTRLIYKCQQLDGILSSPQAQTGFLHCYKHTIPKLQQMLSVLLLFKFYYITENNLMSIVIRSSVTAISHNQSVLSKNIQRWHAWPSASGFVSKRWYGLPSVSHLLVTVSISYIRLGNWATELKLLGKKKHQAVSYALIFIQSLISCFQEYFPGNLHIDSVPGPRAGVVTWHQTNSETLSLPCYYQL